MLIGPSAQGVVTTLDLLVRHLCIRGWEINLMTIQRPSTSAVCQNTPSKVKDKLLHLAPPTSSGLLDFQVNIFIIWVCYSGLFPK